ncbi:hypothetical protein A2V82_01125 [candidate division KSB1 bacterium RBG_16_48_16]|nr:MAG: hypothetical protein A2V82_01125 [candidate division KSB1 bacterium RBG_16_48_16]
MAKVPEQIVRLVSRGLIEFSEKGYRQLFEGPFDENDVQNAVIYGTVVKKEKDQTKVAKYKYTIIGPSLKGDPLYCCGKIRKKSDDKKYFIITFHGASL